MQCEKVNRYSLFVTNLTITLIKLNKMVMKPLWWFALKV